MQLIHFLFPFSSFQLDLRVNLIRQIHCDSFESLPKLQRLSLAGNFLNRTEECVWNGLRQLKELDLGWNEFRTVENSFSNIASTLELLDFRHNINLNMVGILNLQQQSPLFF